MKSFFKIAACLSFLSLCVFSCTLDEIDTQMTDEEAIASIRLECDALESYTIQAEKPQAVSFSVTSTTPWTVTCSGNPDWLTVSPSSSAESSLSEDIVIKAKANDGFVDRSTIVTIQGENTDITHQVTITQLRKGKLVVIPVTEEFEKTGGSLPFTVEANLAWEITAADPWLTFSENSGMGDGSAKTIQAKAEANKSIVRQTTVTVTSGDLKFDFDVTQKGEFLEFLPVDDPSIDRKGGEIEIGVKASMDWKVETDDPSFTVTKVGSDKMKVSAPFNNKFAPKNVTLTLKPVSDEYGDVSNSLVISQDINFKFDGNCEVLPDGSVKLSCGAKSKVTTIDEYRFVTIVLTLGDKNFGEKGELWCATNALGCNIYNQLSLGGNLRIRQDGTLPTAGTSTYKNVSHSGIDQDALNAMTEYRFEVLPDGTVDPSYENVQWHFVNFWYNGELNTQLNFRSIFYDDASAAGTYWFGFYNETSDGTWYVIKSCDVTPVAE